jgi:hypothetical protein
VVVHQSDGSQLLLNVTLPPTFVKENHKADNNARQNVVHER